MSLVVRYRKWLERRGIALDERGLTLIEILGAVTIMSIVSVTMMGYFIAGLERSADESRRIIAANLARTKVAEIRDAVGEEAAYNALVSFVNTSAVKSFREISPVQPPISLPDSPRSVLDEETINGTTYYYILDLDLVNGAARKADLSTVMNPDNPEDYLLQMSVRVYWEGTQTTNPTPAKSTGTDSYVVKRG